MKKYIYNGNEYFDEQKVRRAIFEDKRVALPVIEDDEQWHYYSVQVVEEQQTVDPYIEFAHIKHRKVQELENCFNDARLSSHSHIMSELGFLVNSNVDSYNNICMLIDQTDEQESVLFRTFNNEMVELDVIQLNVIKKELAIHNSKLYQQKWLLKEQIKQATDIEQLDKIEVSFE